jgi:hypothetical protein
MFKTLIKDAQRGLKSLEDSIESEISRKDRLTAALNKGAEYLQSVTNAVNKIAAGNGDQDYYVSAINPPSNSNSWRRWSRQVEICNGINSKEYREFATAWSMFFDKTKRRIEVIDKVIAQLRKEHEELELWIIEKEERWSGSSPELIERQIGEIVEAGKALSMLVIGRDSQIVLRYEEGGTLAGVSTRFSKRRKIFLNLEPLGDQPRHILDIYRALILHELGHKLLHLGESAKEYRAANRLVSKSFHIDPKFSSVFNILLDEQLERHLRDRKKEWRAWFNRLEFFGRTIPQSELRRRLSESKAGSACDLRQLEEQGLIKRYHDDQKAFASIISAGLLIEDYGFSRMAAFFYTLRFRLPRITVAEEWLRECLDEIPDNFLALDLISLHHLAFQIYSIINQQPKPSRFFKIRTKQNGVIMLPIPGDMAGHKDDQKPIITVELTQNRKKVRNKKGLGSKTGNDISTKRSILIPPADPEGEPPQPKFQDKPAKKPAKSVKKPGFPKNPKSDHRISPAWHDIFVEKDGTGAVNGKNADGKSKTTKIMSAKDKLRQRNLSAKEKSRLQKQVKAEAAKKPPKKDEAIPEKKEISLDAPEETGIPHLNVSAPSYVNNMGSAKRNLANRLNQMVAQAKAKMAAKRAVPVKIKQMIANSDTPSDNRNTEQDKRFPALESVCRLEPDQIKWRRAILDARKFTEILRPFLNRQEQTQIMLESQYGGTRLMNSAVKKYLLYRERRIFRDNRVDDLLDFKDTHLSVLIDTSASMKTEGRLDKARTIATTLAVCLDECPNIESAFFGYNNSLYLCGSHGQGLSVGGLQPNGKTNEAAALDFIHREFSTIPSRNKIVIVLSDGQPTSCSVDSVSAVVERMAKRDGFQFVCVMLGPEQHPAYRNTVKIDGTLDRAAIISFGQSLATVLK